MEVSAQSPEVNKAAHNMHLSLKDVGDKINVQSLVDKLTQSGVPQASKLAKSIVDDCLFPWLNEQLTTASAANMLFGLGIPVLAALKMVVDQELAKLPA